MAVQCRDLDLAYHLTGVSVSGISYLLSLSPRSSIEISNYKILLASPLRSGKHSGCPSADSVWTKGSVCDGSSFSDCCDGDGWLFGNIFLSCSRAIRGLVVCIPRSVISTRSGGDGLRFIC